MDINCVSPRWMQRLGSKKRGPVEVRSQITIIGAIIMLVTRAKTVTRAITITRTRTIRRAIQQQEQ